MLVGLPFRFDVCHELNAELTAILVLKVWRVRCSWLLKRRVGAASVL
jgi:hypothetical protein